jgi:GMP reductase
MRAGDLESMRQILAAVPAIEFICLDVANGYSEHFVEYVKQVHKEFPNHTIMVNICF